MDVANEAQQSEARNNDLRRGRLAALGSTIEKISDLKAVVQLDAGGTWYLKVGTTYTRADPFTLTFCDLIDGGWQFCLSNGAVVGPANDVMGCAELVRAMARGVPPLLVKQP